MARESICFSCRHFGGRTTCFKAAEGASGAPGLAAGSFVAACSHFASVGGETGRQRIDEALRPGARRPSE